MIVNSSNLINNRDPRFFDNSDMFEPERWLDQQQRSKAKFSTVVRLDLELPCVLDGSLPCKKFSVSSLHCCKDFMWNIATSLWKWSSEL